MDPLYLTQVVFACLLALCSCLGNTTACIAMTLSSVRKCPYFINLMFLELVAIIFGPVTYLVAVFFEPSWLREGTFTCMGAIVLQKFSLIGSLLSLTFLAWFHCHKRELPQRKIVLVFSILSSWFLPAIILSSAFLAQKSQFLDIPWFMCSTTTTLQGYSWLGIIIVVIAISVHSFSLWLSFSSSMSKNTYYLQDHWKRHRREVTVNDPECSTFHMSYSESTSVSLDKIFNVLPGKKTSVGQISFFNANRNWALNYQPEIPKSGEGKTEKAPKTNSDSNDVFYDNDLKIETSKAALGYGVEKERHSTGCDSVFIDPSEACIPTEQSSDYKSSVESMKSVSSTDESSSRTPCSIELVVAPTCSDASPSGHGTDGTDAMSNSSNATKISAHSSANHSPTATAETPFSNTYSRVKHPAMSPFPSASSRSDYSPTNNRMTSISPSRQTPLSAGSHNIHSCYSPVLNTSPWYYTISPRSPNLSTLGFGDIRKYKRAKFISPTTLDFAKTDRTINEFKKIVLIVTCLSMIGCLLFSIVFILRTVGLVLPEEVLRFSTMVLFVKSAMTPVLYGVCFTRHRLACKKYIKSKLPLNPEAEKKCSYNLNDAAVIGVYLAQDDCGVQLEKHSVLPY